jgi:hypothetical protein
MGALPIKPVFVVKGDFDCGLLVAAVGLDQPFAETFDLLQSVTLRRVAPQSNAL